MLYRIRARIRLILKLTQNHARSLAAFAFTYKVCLLAQRAGNGKKQEESHHTFLAGLVAGYLVFGRQKRTGVDQQIVIYIFARVILGLAKIILKQIHGTGSIHRAQFAGRIESAAWPCFASLSWATVMWIFRWHPAVLQSGLQSSMVYM